MGWFLKSVKTKKQTRKPAVFKKPSAPRQPWLGKPWDPQATLRLVGLLAGLMTMAALGGAWYMGSQKAALKVSQSRASAPTVVFTTVPGWMQPVVQDELRVMVAQRIGNDPLDADGLNRAVEFLSHNPWVKHVRTVKRFVNGRVEADVQFRQPVAFVLYGGWFYVVDADGVRLPHRYQQPSGGYVAIEGVPTAVPEPGMIWPGLRPEKNPVLAGLRLIDLLGRKEFGGQIARVNVSNYDGVKDPRQPHLSLVTHTGGIIHWGRAAGEEKFFEPDYKIKIARLENLTKRPPYSIDMGGQIVEIHRDYVAYRPKSSVSDQFAVDSQ